MTHWVFIPIMIVLSITDITDRVIPNWLVLPATFVGGIVTSNWIWIIVLFLIGALMFNRKYWRGGDVKLLALVGSFLGVLAIPVLATTVILIKLYRVFRADYRALPVAPFMFIATIGLTLTVQLLNIKTP